MLASRFAVRTARTMAPRVSMVNAAARRTYAAPATDSKPPIELYGVDGTYASALVCVFLGLREGVVMALDDAALFGVS